MDIFPIRPREERPRPSYSQIMINNKFLSRILNRKTKEENNQQLEEIIDIDKDIYKSSNKTIKFIESKSII